MTVIPITFDPSAKPSTVVSGAAVSYNGFEFPPAITSRAKFVPVYDDSNRSVKYLRLELTISFYLFHGMNLGTGTFASPNTSNNLFSGSYNRSSHVPANAKDGTKTTDEEMDNLRLRLSQPCQKLVFKSQGVGSVSINDGSTPSLDVDNGPKPRVVTWRPLSNNACFVEWEVTSCFVPCPGIDAVNGKLVAQFPYSVSFDVNEAGLSVRTISGRLEFALTRLPDSGSATPSISAEYDFSYYRDQITAFFPMMRRFKRTQKYTMSEDRKCISFSLTDTEIDSDEAYGEGCAHEEARLVVNNETPMAWTVWDVTLSGRITVAAGYTKAYALAEINRLFARYYMVCGSRAYTNSLVSASASEREQGETTEMSLVNTAKRVLTHMQLEDDIFGRSVSFSLRWRLFTTLQTVLAASGLFVPARVSTDPIGNPTAPDLTGDAANAAQDSAWGQWKASLSTFLDSGGYSNLTMNQEDDVILTLCEEFVPGGAVDGGQDAPVPLAEKDYDERDTEAISNANSWFKYECKFHLEVNDHSTLHHPLGNFVADQEISESPNNSVNNAVIYGGFRVPSIPDASQNPLIHYHRQPSYVLHVMGYAVRLNYPVPVPKVTKAYGQDVRRIGRWVTHPEILSIGTDVVSGKDYKIYANKWYLTYALAGPPTNSKILTEGHPEIYRR